ncbi:MAG TPA: hypothetical protein VLJ37_12865 [bacterium]|nr:hypothetical protein [bacterium]
MTLAIGQQWFSIFGTRPWSVPLVNDGVIVPPELLISPPPRSPGSASAVDGDGWLPRAWSHSGAGRRDDGRLSAAGSATGSLPLLPGEAKTPDEVLRILRRYPWIFGPFRPISHEARKKSGGYPTLQDLFRDYFRTLLRNDPAIFKEHVVATIRSLAKNPAYAHHIQFIRWWDDGQIDPAIDNLASVNPARGLVLEDAAGGIIHQYFGCWIEKDPVEQDRVPPKDPAASLSASQLGEVTQRLTDAGLTSSGESDSAQTSALKCAVYFLARAAYPEAFGFSAPSVPKAAAASAGWMGLGFKSSVQPVMRHPKLPSYPWVYPREGYGEPEVWSRFFRELNPEEIGDRKLMGDLLKAAVTDHPLEIAAMDLDEAAISKFLYDLLAARASEEISPGRFAFLGNRIRLVLKRSLPAGIGWKVEEIREYAVVGDPENRALEESPLRLIDPKPKR